MTARTRATVTGGLIAASWANLLLIDTWQGLLSPMHAALAGRLPTLEAYWAALIVLLSAAVLGVLGTSVRIRRSPHTRTLSGDLLLIAGLILLIPVIWHEMGGVLPIVDLQMHQRFPSVMHGVVAVLLLTGILILRHWRSCMRALRLALLWTSPFLAITIGRAGFSLWRIDIAAMRQPVATHIETISRIGPRVIIVVFDELDFTFAFAARPARIQLPAFDSLRAESVFALDASAPDNATETSLPSYLFGRPVSSVAWKTLYTEGVVFRGDRQVRNIASEPTIFHDAARFGARSELVGFHLPYCRWPFAALLDRCTWRPLTWGGVFDGPVGLGAALARQLKSFVVIGNRQAAIDRLEELSAASVRAIEDTSHRMVFLHLPVPHLPPIWDAARDRYSLTQTSASAYLDNLELTDRILARLMIAVQGSRDMERTFLIVTSDHPWRARLIRDQKGGRIPFIIRTPSREPIDVRNHVDAVDVRELSALILGGKLDSAAGISAWLEGRHSRTRPR